MQVALAVALILAAAGTTPTGGVDTEAPPAASAGAPAAPAARPGPTGLARFTARPRYDGASISPKGSYLALVATERGVRRLVIVDLATRKFASTLDPGGDTMVGRFMWATDRRVVAELAYQDAAMAAPSSTGELYGVNADGREGRMLFGPRVRNAGEHASARLVDRVGDGTVLIQTRDWREFGDQRSRLESLDASSGGHGLVAMSPIPEAWFYVDERGQLRLSGGRDLQNRLHFFLREPDRSWRELTALKGVTAASHPMGFIGKDRSILLWEPAGQGFDLFAVSVESGERTALARTRIAPPSHVYLDSATQRVVAVESHPDLPVVDLVDPQHPVARAIAALQEAYPGQHVQVYDRTDDDRLAVARVSSDRNPGLILLVDTATLKAEPIAEVRPWIDPEQMAETAALHLNASDGFRIHAYLTLPPGLPAGARPPLVVLTHGGPHGVRDRWTFDPEVQLLAAEGFAVLQVNYRGSGGYGDAFGEAGYRRWGDRVVQDVVDVTRHLVKKGQVDGGRVCALGASFGAFASMQAAILAPDLFRCAVGYAGIYDLTLMSSEGDIRLSRLGRGYLSTVVGEDEEALRRASPAHHADQLLARVLLLHGGKDERAPISHAEALRDALVKAGRPPEWVVEPSEGHGFYGEAVRERTYRRVVEFLRASTQPGPGTAAAPGTPAASAAPAAPR